MKYKHIFWDYNGTLLNDVSLSVEIINGMLQKRGIPAMTIEKYRELFDFPVKKYYERAGFDFNKESFEKTGTEFIIQYNKKVVNAELHGGVFDLLKKVKESGIKQSILSAREIEQLKQETERFKIAGFFEFICGLDNHYAGSKTKIAEDLIEKTGLAPGEIILIGDTTHDCEVAEKTGIDILSVSYGHHPAYKLRKCGSPVVSSVSEAEKYIFG